MGERLDRALKMPLSQIVSTLETWRRMAVANSPSSAASRRCTPTTLTRSAFARKLGYEERHHDDNAQEPSLKKFRLLEPDDFAYVQVSLDGGSATVSRCDPRRGSSSRRSRPRSS